MPDDKYLVRSPLLDPQQRVLGYKLGWQKDGNGVSVGTFPELALLVSGFQGDTGLGTVFLDGNPLALPDEVLQVMAPPHTVWGFHREELSETSQPAFAALREKGFGLSLEGADLVFLRENDTLLSVLTHLEVEAKSADLVAMNSFVRQGHPAISLLAGQPSGWAGYDACAALGVPAFFETLCRSPRAMNASGVLNPQAALILQLMQMVQANTDVRHLEKLLKRDAVLSYKLFRYINSAGFGIEVEIQSLRHAVAMLGYTPLFRWLSLLLAMTNTVGFSPALLQAAIIRGRLTELLGQGLLSRSESDELFVVGMFSLLGEMLGVPITEVLSQIVLPDAIVQALLSREGKYGPFISLTEACEQEHGCAADLADALFFTAARVNDAHLSALVWAQGIKL